MDVNVLHAEEYHRPDFNTMIETTVRLLEEYNIRFDSASRIFVDGANPSFITALKQIAFYKKNYPSVYDLQFLQQNMFVICEPRLKDMRLQQHTLKSETTNLKGREAH
jgi:hypothetical protein